MENFEENSQTFNIDKLLFGLSESNEEVEGYSLKDQSNELSNTNALVINNQTVLDFLDCPTTTISLITETDSCGEENQRLIARNIIANESIEIHNLSNHVLTFNSALKSAVDMRKTLSNNPNADILNHEFIQNINLNLQKEKDGEIGIGEYRNYDYVGRPVDVQVAEMKNGTLVPCTKWQPIEGGNNNVFKAMNFLINWTNSNDFKQLNPIERAAMFHAEFIHIHPFRDGNGRTGRILLNYMLAIDGLPLTNISGASRDEYYNALNNAIDNKDYTNLIKVIKSNQIDKSRDLYSMLFNYKNNDGAKNMKFDYSIGGQ